jgi:hypothetical protein
MITLLTELPASALAQLPRPYVLNYALPLPCRLPAPTPLKNLPLPLHCPYPDGVLTALAILYLSDSRGWASVAEIARFVRFEFKYYYTPETAVDFLERLSDHALCIVNGGDESADCEAKAWRPYFHCRLEDGADSGGKPELIHVQLKRERLLSAYAWIRRTIRVETVDECEMARVHVRSVALMQTLLSLPPPLWEGYYSSSESSSAGSWNHSRNTGSGTLKNSNHMRKAADHPTIPFVVLQEPREESLVEDVEKMMLSSSSGTFGAPEKVAAAAIDLPDSYKQLAAACGALLAAASKKLPARTFVIGRD